MTPEEFLKWEYYSQDTIDVKRIYIDMAGDIVSGVLLSQLIYWHLPSKKGETKMGVEHEGHLWVRKKREEWWEECRITPKQFDRSSRQLQELGFAEIKKFVHEGRETVHIRLLLENVIEAIKEKINSPTKLKKKNRGKRSSPKGETSVDQRGNVVTPNGKRESEENPENTDISEGKNSQTTAKNTAKNTPVMSKKSETGKQEDIPNQKPNQDSSIEKDVKKVPQKINRKGLRYNFGQIPPSQYRECLAAYEKLLPDQKGVVDSYVEHETMLWEFKSDEDPENKKKKFICEFMLAHPIAKYWKSMTPEQRQAELEASPQYQKKKKADYINSLDINDPNVNLLDLMYA